MTQKVTQTIKELEAPTTPPEEAGKKRSWRDPRLSLIGFLVVALIAGGGVVTAGHLMYLTSSGYKLDITRPGFKDIPKKDLVEVNRNQTYDSTSPIDKTALDNEQKSMNSRFQELDRYGDFGDDELPKLQDKVLEEGPETGL